MNDSNCISYRSLLQKERLYLSLLPLLILPYLLYGSTTKKAKTYNSGYSLVVTHLTTNPPVRCLNRAERTGSLVFNVLWSYVEDMAMCGVHIPLRYHVLHELGKLMLVHITSSVGSFVHNWALGWSLSRISCWGGIR
jgi:hypothetical protein